MPPTSTLLRLTSTRAWMVAMVHLLMLAAVYMVSAVGYWLAGIGVLTVRMRTETACPEVAPAKGGKMEPGHPTGRPKRGTPSDR